MMLWLKTFFEIRWTVMSRSDELKTGFCRIYCPKRGKLAGLRYSYPPKPSLHFKELGRRTFWILLISIEVSVGWR